MQSQSEGYPLQGTRAQIMLERGMKAAQAAGRSQRQVAKELGHRSSVVLSHMTLGRVPIPIDKAERIAVALGLEPKAFLLAVLEQRHPDIDFNSLFNISFSSAATVRKLESIAGCSLDDLPADTRETLEEVVGARNPQRRWLALPELQTVELIRDLRPSSPTEGLSDEDRQSIEKALRR
jgi:hypothetical protein